MLQFPFPAIQQKRVVRRVSQYELTSKEKPDASPEGSIPGVSQDALQRYGTLRRSPEQIEPPGLQKGPETRRGSGAEGDRTPDLRAASAALSRLSYGPKDLQSIASKGMVSMHSARREFFPVLLGGTAPEGLQTIVVARLVGEDMDDHVDEI